MSTREALIREIERQPEFVVEKLQRYLHSLNKTQAALQVPEKEKIVGEVDEKGWPVGYFEKFSGILADEPFERPPQLPLEKREEW